MPEAKTDQRAAAPRFDEHLARAYVGRIAQLYSGECDLAAMSEAALDCIATRHTRDALARRVSGLLAPPAPLAFAAA